MLRLGSSWPTAAAVRGKVTVSASRPSMFSRLISSSPRSPAGCFYRRGVFQGQLRHHQTQRASTWTVISKKPLESDAVLGRLVAINVAVTGGWVVAFALGGALKRLMIKSFVTSPAHMSSSAYHSVITATFSHPNPALLIINMCGLCYFGRGVCSALGPRLFLRLYLTTSAVSSLVAVHLIEQTGKNGFYAGATSSVCGLTAMSVLLNPCAATILPGLLFIILPIGTVNVDPQVASARSVNMMTYLSGALSGGAFYAYLRLSRTLRRLR